MTTYIVQVSKGMRCDRFEVEATSEVEAILEVRGGKGTLIPGPESPEPRSYYRCLGTVEEFEEQERKDKEASRTYPVLPNEHAYLQE